VPANKLINEVQQSCELLHRLTGIRSNLFRPPYGQLTLAKAGKLWADEQSIVLWNVDSRDYQMTDPAQLVQWAEMYQPKSGDIVLLHDSYPYATSSLASLARRVFERGLKFEPIRIHSSLLNFGRKLNNLGCLGIRVSAPYILWSFSVVEL
jgi:peptidoglycan/xylan/chitin deacetylase (PgdA/CDA1 family)